jgi:hypothetical protein
VALSSPSYRKSFFGSYQARSASCTLSEMVCVGKLFAIAAIISLIVGFIRWPQPETGFYTIRLKNRAYAFGSEYWAFSICAIFATLAASYYWLSSIRSFQLSGVVTHLHFWLSAISAFAFLLLIPGWQAFSSRAIALSGERNSMAVLLINSCLDSALLARAGYFCCRLCLEGFLRTERLAPVTENRFSGPGGIPPHSDCLIFCFRMDRTINTQIRVRQINQTSEISASCILSLRDSLRDISSLPIE